MIVKKDEHQREIKEKMRDGNGQCILDMIHKPNAIKNVRLLSTITLKPMHSIGKHEHINETEYYYILEGKGKVIESDGEKIVEKGDTVITTDKQSHSIENIGESDLVFLAIIVTF